MRSIHTTLLTVILTASVAAQTLRTTQPTNYLREGPASYFQIIASLPASTDVNKVEQKGSWFKVKTDGNETGWLSENSFAPRDGTGGRDQRMLQGKTSSRASRAELAAAVKGFGDKYVQSGADGGQEISKFSEPVVTAQQMEEFEHSFSVEPFRGYMQVERPFDIQFHEEAVGLGIARRIIAEKGLVNDRTATLYLNLIGNRLSKYTKAFDLGFRFYVLDDAKAGAFAVPGGYIFVTKGMLAACANEAELAAVVAHEMVHVVQRHGVKELKKSEAKIKSESAFAELEAETGAGDAEEQELEEYANSVYQDLIAPRLLSYEKDADALTMVYLKRAGYDPTALLSILQRIHEPSAATREIFDDRYMKKDEMEERIGNVRSLIKEEGYRARADRRFADRYQRSIGSIR
ncbi:MAG: M48 family metalloprotease [Bacteroidetes bacterium]|nr:M48 family metalloprotease [Bacteroidota bacterium]